MKLYFGCVSQFIGTEGENEKHSTGFTLSSCLPLPVSIDAKVLNDFVCAFFSYVHRGLIERKAAGVAAAANTYWKLDIVSVVLGSYERRILITSAHVIWHIQNSRAAGS